MADTKWDREMAKIDKQLASISDEELMKVAERDAAVAPAAAVRGKPVAPVAVAQKPRGMFGVYARLGLAGALGVLMLFWPYAYSCGLGLTGYLAAVATVIGGGVWSAVWSWRQRAPISHILSIGLVAWGLVLGGLEVLPRIGYAVASESHPATWSCP